MSTGEQLREYQADNRRRTVEKVKAAIQTMDAELAEHGYYPHNDGRITRKEVCRRAGLGESTLKNRTHANTAVMVDRWLKRLRKRAPTLKPAAEGAKQARIASLTEQLHRIANQYNRFKIEYEQLQKTNCELEEENIVLKQQLATLQSEGYKIIALHTKRLDP